MGAGTPRDTRVVESGPGGEDLAAGAWQRLEALPDPRSPQGRIYPLACLIAIAACAFTAAGNDRLTAVGQWTRRASQADLARLRAPWDPVAGRYRAPDEKTIRVVLDRLDPRALSRALPGPRPRRRRSGGPPALRRAAGGAGAVTRPGALPGRRRGWPGAGYGPSPWTARPRGEPAAAMAPGFICPIQDLFPAGIAVQRLPCSKLPGHELLHCTAFATQNATQSKEVLGSVFEKRSQPGAPLRNRTIDLLLTMHTSVGSLPGRHFPQAAGKRRSGSCPGLRRLRSPRPSRLQPSSSWHGSMPSVCSVRRTPGLPFKPGLWGCMPASHVHSDGQRTVRRSFLSRPPRARRPR